MLCKKYYQQRKKSGLRSLEPSTVLQRAQNVLRSTQHIHVFPKNLFGKHTYFHNWSTLGPRADGALVAVKRAQQQSFWGDVYSGGKVINQAFFGKQNRTTGRKKACTVRSRILV